jgi:hypothetical protein
MMFFTQLLPKSKNRRRGKGVPLPSSRTMDVPDCLSVGGQGVLPVKQIRISPFGSGSFGGKKLLLVQPGVGRKNSGSVMPPPGRFPYGLCDWLIISRLHFLTQTQSLIFPLLTKHRQKTSVCK